MLLGKLDIAFKRKYPTNKVGDNFIGFWVAKFYYSRKLTYFSEIPFQYLQGQVPADMIQKPTVIDLKEDETGGMLLVLNELQGVIYGKKHMVYLDKNGDIRTALDGRDVHNFNEYDKMGLKEAGKKYRIRMMQDDWSPYANNFIQQLNPKSKIFSPIVLNTINLSREKKSGSPEKKAYTFFYLIKMFCTYLTNLKREADLRFIMKTRFHLSLMHCFNSFCFLSSNLP